MAASGSVTPVRQGDGNERVAQVVQPHGLPPLTVQAHLIPCVLNRAEGVTAGLRLATRGAEHEGVPVGEPEVALGLPEAVCS
jgi:hypothetical protein